VWTQWEHDAVLSMIIGGWRPLTRLLTFLSEMLFFCPSVVTCARGWLQAATTRHRAVYLESEGVGFVACRDVDF